MHISDKEMCIEFFYHLTFIFLANRVLPFATVFQPPFPIRLPEFPVHTRHRVAIAVGVITQKFVFELERYLFELRFWILFGKEKEFG